MIKATMTGAEPKDAFAEWLENKEQVREAG